MAIEFCPLADKVGNLADWFAVGVGFIAAVSTTVVAYLAYRTSERAAGIAEEAKGIAQQQHGEAVAQREGVARILGRLLLTELGSLPARLDMIRRLLDESLTFDGKIGVKDLAKFTEALDEAEAVLMPSSVAVVDRLHNLPDVLGADLATLIGNCQALNTIANRVHARCSLDLDGPVGRPGRLRYGGELRDLALLVQHTADSTIMAATFAVEFRRFVGVDAGDYSGMESNARKMLKQWEDA